MSSRAFLAAGLLLIALVIGFALLVENRSSPTPIAEAPAPVSAAPVPEITVPEAPPPVPITEEMVADLLYGLRYLEVEGRFGVASEDIATEYKPGVDGYTASYAITWHIWKNPDGSRVRLGFVRDKLEQKEYLSPASTGS